VFHTPIERTHGLSETLVEHTTDDRVGDTAAVGYVQGEEVKIVCGGRMLEYNL